MKGVAGGKIAWVRLNKCRHSQKKKDKKTKKRFHVLADKGVLIGQYHLRLAGAAFL